MNENSTHRAKSSPWSEEPDQKEVKHRDLCPERYQGQEAVTEVDRSKKGCLGKCSMSFLSRMQIPGVTWDLANIKRGTKKGPAGHSCYCPFTGVGDTEWPAEQMVAS